MRLVLTGSEGFIGRPLAAALSNAGHAVRRADISNRAGNRVDVSRPADCAAVCEGAEVVIHSAAIHDAKAVGSDPLRMIAINVGGTLNMLRAAADAGVRRFVLLSTGKVYGEPESLPSWETQLPAPVEPYALAKLVGEEYARHFHATRGLETVVIRPFSVYGPGQELDSGYIGMLLHGLREGLPVELPGAPGFLRDFIHIDDVVELCRRAALAPLPPVTILNAGSGRATRLDELARIFTGIAGESLSVSFRPPGTGTLSRTQAGMSLAADLLDFVPAVSLEVGLHTAIEWLEDTPALAAGRLA